MHEKIHSSDPKVRHPHACQHCEYRSGSKYKLKIHMLRHAESAPEYHCSIDGCQYTTLVKYYLQTHERRHNLVNLFCTFEDCKYKTKYTYKLRKHVGTHHSGKRERNIQCPICPKAFYNVKIMKYHLRTHTNERPWRCSLCIYESKRLNSLRHHLEVAHQKFAKSIEQGRHECKVCRFTTSFGESFRQHLESHSDDRPFTCTFPGCNYRAKRKSTLKRHATQHSPETMGCSKSGCSYVANSKGLLRAHYKSHNKPFPCVFPYCNGAFHNEIGLLNHQKVHDPNRKFQCPHCPRRFQRKGYVRNHVNTYHAPVNKFQCPHCQQSTNNRYNLRKHIETMHPSGQISCSESGCQYKNFSPYDMASHRKKFHDENRSFKCARCTCRFTLRSCLKIHILKFHGKPKLSFNGSNSQTQPATAEVKHYCGTCHFDFRDHKTFIKHSILHRAASVVLPRLKIKIMCMSECEREIYEQDPDIGPNEYTYTHFYSYVFVQTTGMQMRQIAPAVPIKFLNMTSSNMWSC